MFSRIAGDYDVTEICQNNTEICQNKMKLLK